MTSAVFEMFQPFSRSLPTRKARSALSLNSRNVPAFVSPAFARFWESASSFGEATTKQTYTLKDFDATKVDPPKEAIAKLGGAAGPH